MSHPCHVREHTGILGISVVLNESSAVPIQLQQNNAEINIEKRKIEE